MALLQGKAFYAKVLGKAQPAYTPGEFEWSIDIAIDPKTRDRLLEAGMSPDYVKDKGGERGEFIQFKRRSVTRNGEPGKPIEVVGPDKQPWDQRKLIGNGSTVNVKYLLNEVESGKKIKLKPGVLAIQVVDHIPYEGSNDDDFPEINEAGEESWEVNAA